MLIHCPRCQARATLPDSKEGAKVRCGECRRVFVAVPRGGKASGPNVGLLVGIGVGAVLVLGGLWALSNGDDSPAMAAKPGTAAPQTASTRAVSRPEEPRVDPLGWDGPVVQAAVAIHTAARRGDLAGIQRALDPARAWASRNGAGDASDPDPSAFRALPSAERAQFVDDTARGLIEGAGKAQVADWRPFDGEVLSMDDRLALVQLSVSPADPEQGAEKRLIRWRLAQTEPGVWRAYDWESEADRVEAKQAARVERGLGKVELSDGSKVFEKEPEPLGHLPDTPPEIAAEIDRLYPVMLDLDLTTESNDARDALVELGRPAIPILLTGLFETKLDSPEDAIRANIIVQALRDITGQDFGYKPQRLASSATGGTDERRASAIRQWFAWWARNEATFREAEVQEDGTADLIELTEKEKAWLERHKD